MGRMNLGLTGTWYNPNLSGDGYYTAAGHIWSYNYFDLSADIPVTKEMTATIGVDSIADKNPPLVPSGNFSACPTVGCNDNTWLGMYDTMGRYIFLHVEAKFCFKGQKAAGFGRRFRCGRGQAGDGPRDPAAGCRLAAAAAGGWARLPLCPVPPSSFPTTAPPALSIRIRVLEDQQTVLINRAQAAASAAQARRLRGGGSAG